MEKGYVVQGEVYAEPVLEAEVVAAEPIMGEVVGEVVPSATDHLPEALDGAPRLALVAAGSADALRFDHADVLRAGGEAPLSANGKHVGLYWPQPRNAWGHWDYIDLGCSDRVRPLRVKLELPYIIFYSREHGEFAFDVAMWKLHEGTHLVAVKACAGNPGGPTRMSKDACGRDFVLHADGTIGPRTAQHLRLGVFVPKPPGPGKPCGPGWSAHQNIDMCGQGDVEIIHNWRATHSIEDLQRIVEQKGYSAFTVSSGQPSFGHAALKKFPYQLTAGHCKPITTCCNHPCTIYIWSGGRSGSPSGKVAPGGSVTLEHVGALTYAASEAHARARGGRLLTLTEARAHMGGRPLCPGDDQWCAVAGRDWVQIGSRHHHAGKSHMQQCGGYPPWGDDANNMTYGRPTWNVYALYTTASIPALERWPTAEVGEEGGGGGLQSITGTWVPTRLGDWRGCPVGKEARVTTYKYVVQGNGDWVDELYPSHRGHVEPAEESGLYEGYGVEPGRYPAKWRLQPNGVLVAAWGDQFNVVYYLVREGDPRTATTGGAAHLNNELNNVARNTDDTHRARDLVDQGADLSSTNGDPWHHTPLHQASYHGRYAMAETLVGLGAPLHLHSNPCGRGRHGTPLELARGGGHHAIAEMLKRNGGEEPVAVGGGAAPVTSLDDWVGQSCESFPNGQPGRIVETFQFTREGAIYVTTGTASGRNTYTRHGDTLQHQQHAQITATLQPNGELAWSHGYGSRICGRGGGGGGYEENWARIWCPIAGHPDMDQGAYHEPIGLCCYTTRKYEHDRPDDEIFCNFILGLPILTGLWIGTLCYQPCGCICAHQVPWFGDCPCSEQRVTKHFVEKYPHLVTKGPARMER